MPTVIIGDKELRRKLQKLADPTQIVPALKEAAQHIKTEIQKYPEGNQHRPQPFKTQKQRRFFFWALRNGIIEVPYRRGQSPGSEDHQQSWTIKGMKGGLQQLIGSDTSYGKYLQDPEDQAWMHKGRWKTTDEIAKQEEERVLKEIQQRVDQILAGR